MKYIIREMTRADWESVREIYLQGIRSKQSTFETTAPEYEVWDYDENH